MNEDEGIQMDNTGGSIVSTPLSSHTPHTSSHTPHGALKSATNKLVGTTFFGPDFNIDSVNKGI